MMRKVFSSLCMLLALALIAFEVRETMWGILPIGDRLVPAIFDVILAVSLFGMHRYLSAAAPVRLLRALWLIFLIVSGLIATTFSSMVFYIEEFDAGRTYEGRYEDCYKVWAARGLVEGGAEITHRGEQNSIESISRAFAAGARGVEVDVHFDPDRGRFIVSHDYPYNLKNGEILTLETLLETTGGGHYYWLDFKKLRHLSDAELKRSIAELQRLSQRFGLQQKFYVEGEAPLSLAAYRQAGFKTIFDSHPLADTHPLSSMVINLYKIVYYFGDFDVMGMNYNFGDSQDPIYGARTRALLGPIPVFIYHVPDDSAVLQELASNPAVRVILVVHHNLNRYQVNACGDK